MTLDNYRQNLKQIIKNVPIDKTLLCNMKSDYNRIEFLEIFKFYKETLELNCDYGITPNYLFFVDRDSINAIAGLSSNGYYLIGINRGTINWLIRNFKLNNNLISKSNIKLFKKLEPYLDIAINNLMYQLSCHFTFYHEMAHLIQKSDFLEFNMQENPLPVKDFDINRHLMEIDADTFSTLSIGAHILQYSENIFGDNISKSILESLIVLFSIPIIFYLLSFEGNKDVIYFKEKTHPHPAIRLTNILMVLTNYINGSLDTKKKGFRVSLGDMFIYAMEIAEELQYLFFKDSIVSKYKVDVLENRADIKEYMFELVTLNGKDDKTATNKWNLKNSNK